MEIIPYMEGWDSFGKLMYDFVIDNRNKLSKDSFDLILGFTRGGYIVALFLSALLRDNVQNAYDIEEKPHKASVRSIPPGISTKRYRHPCFVMQDAASKEDMDDLRNGLEWDLRKFLKDIQTNKSNKKLSVLLVDDNLTGSTRLLTFEKEMKEWDFLDVKTLCYVRHKAFEVPKFAYEVRQFPQDKDYFVMPWHKKEDPKDIDLDRRKQRFAFIFQKNENFNFENFVKRLKNIIPPYEYIPNYTDEEGVVFNRGETYILMQIKKDYINFRYKYNKIYPPKTCLIQKQPGFKNKLYINNTFSFCEDDEKLILRSNACLLCSFLNCNFEFIKAVLKENEQTNELEIFPIHKLIPKNQKKLIDLAKKWFNKNFPLLNIK